MLHIAKIIDARTKNFFLHHFDQTLYGIQIKKLKNKYKNKRCFIIGNGPSLNADDLNKLKGEYTFAFNRIYLIFEQTEWRPTFYCTQDVKIVQNSIEEIRKKIETPYVFAPINLKWYYNLDLKTKYYFSQRQVPEGKIPDFSDIIDNRIYTGNTVAYTAIQIAIYMGFKEIYLIGVDHNFHISQDREGKLKIDNSVKDYFCSDYNKDKESLFIPKLEVSTLAYIAAKKYAKKKNIAIYNATRGGKLEVFDRVNFDDLFD